MAEARSKGWLNSPAYKKRADHEARTGCVTNMHQLGWACERWAKASGEPVEFRKMIHLATDGAGVYSDVRIVRTHGKMWRMEVDTGFKIRVAGNVTAKRKLDTPLLPGPVAMAIWFELENSNGSVRIRSREDQACP
ncbi:hypothetical protein [Pseudomonas mediterranea]|uniref:hypothetical protein n=1 Tax=Pseudomonas mediterranea TaxID=183795 RepID=UPI0006D8B428|nr:hypothetical protein [Pseudomonas mediterranea]